MTTRQSSMLSLLAGGQLYNNNTSKVLWGLTFGCSYFMVYNIHMVTKLVKIISKATLTLAYLVH